MAQLFRPGADTIARLVLISTLVLPVLGFGLAYAMRQAPYSTDQGYTLDQPVPFSHKHHVGDLGIDCRYCHTGVETSRYAGLPPTSTCMSCHSQIWTNAKLLAPVRESFAHDTPIHWNRVHKLAGYVYFDHSIHVAKGVACADCHGPVHQMALMRQAAPLTMGWCLSCHRDPAPHLAPLDREFDTSWTPDQTPLKEREKFLVERHIQVSHLTDCSVCHR